MQENNQLINDELLPEEPIDAGDGTEKEKEEPIELMEKPFDPTQIKIETKTPSLDTLIKRIDKGAIQMNTETPNKGVLSCL